MDKMSTDSDIIQSNQNQRSTTRLRHDQIKSSNYGKTQYSVTVQFPGDTHVGELSVNIDEIVCQDLISNTGLPSLFRETHPHENWMLVRSSTSQNTGWVPKIFLERIIPRNRVDVNTVSKKSSSLNDLMINDESSKMVYSGVELNPELEVLPKSRNSSVAEVGRTFSESSLSENTIFLRDRLRRTFSETSLFRRTHQIPIGDRYLGRHQIGFENENDRAVIQLINNYSLGSTSTGIHPLRENGPFFIEILNKGTQKLHQQNPLQIESASNIQEERTTDKPENSTSITITPCNFSTSNQTCQICFDEIQPKELILFLCSKKHFPSELTPHAICRDCYESFIAVKLSENTAKFGCVSTECEINFIVQVDILKKIFDKELGEKVLNKRRQEMNLQNPNSRSCPTPDCQYTTVKKLKQKKIHCPVCDKNFCADCRLTWKGNHIKRQLNRCVQADSNMVFQSGVKEKTALKDIDFRKFIDLRKWKKDDGRQEIAREFYKLPFWIKIWSPLMFLILFGLSQAVVTVLAAVVIVVAVLVLFFGGICGIAWLKDAKDHNFSVANKDFKILFMILFFLLSMTLGNIFSVISLATLITCLICATTALPLLICLVIMPGVFIMHMFDVDAESNAKSCPRCKTLIQRSYGCNHMTCEICKYDFCYVCMSPWSRCGAQYNHLINKFVFYTFLDGWKFWSSACITSRGYKTYPQRQKGLIQVTLLVMSPIVIATGIVLVLPGVFGIILKKISEERLFRNALQGSGSLLFISVLAVCSVLSVLIGFPVVLIAWLLASAVFMVVTPVDIFIDVTVWFLRAVKSVLKVLLNSCSFGKSNLDDLEMM